MEKKQIVQKLKENEINCSPVWITLELGNDGYDSLKGYIHEIQYNFVTLQTEEGRISINFKQICEIF